MLVMAEEINSYTTISVKPDTKGTLREKKAEGETYDDYINSLINKQDSE